MATNQNTTNILGVDVAAIYVSTGQSINPELSPQQFALGQMIQAQNGGEFVFVQASTSISGNDFVAITLGFQANSITTTNAQETATPGFTIGVAPATTVGVLAGQWFWAQTRGKAVTANLGAASTTGVILYTTAVAGVLSSVTGSSSSTAVAGVVCVASNSSLAASAGTVVMSWPRVVQQSSSGGLFNQPNP